MIEIRDVRKSFSKQTVLEGISINIEAGDIFGLVGVSGAGKSTLLRCINRLEEIDSGSISIDGRDIGAVTGRDLLELRRSIGMVFQQFSLMERRNVYENVFLPLRCAGVQKKDVDVRIKDLLELVGLKNKLNSLPRELSGGQKQRVAIARALASQPKVLLCDEATSALDPNVTEDVLDLLKNINRELGLTIVVVTHEIAVMKMVCNRIGLLHSGKLEATGEVKHIFLERPDLLTEFSRDVGLLPTTQPGSSLIRIVQDQSTGNAQLARLAIASGVIFEVLWGGIDRYRDTVSGSFIIQFPMDRKLELEASMRELGIKWSAL